MRLLRIVYVVGGHWVGRSIERSFPDRDIFRSILLRDPVSQFLSHYNYRMMRYLSQGLRPYAVDIAYRARRPDFLTHFILNTFVGDPLATPCRDVLGREICANEPLYLQLRVRGRPHALQ